MVADKLFVSKIMHRAMIDVDESGIKAAGATVVMAKTSSFEDQPRPILVHIEKPFVFMLRYESMPLFVGQLVHL